MSSYKTGVSFGSYRILRRIGAGGMGEVYLVRHASAPAESPPAVLKRLHAAFADNPKMREMFLNEVEIISKLDHKNIIKLLDSGEIDSNLYMVTEFVWGVSLKEIIDKCRKNNIDVPYMLAARIIRDVCDALDYAHNLRIDGKDAGIVHLDINPNNIMVNFDGVPKVLDFGIAHAAYLGDQESFKELKGTIAYMSPEQCQGMTPDHRSDIFSLGIVLYELATRTPLFARETNEYMVIKAITEGIIPPPSNLIKGFPRALEDVILMALKVSPNERFQSAAEFKEALELYMAEIEFDPEQENVNAWLKRLFPEKYDEFAAFMLPARKRTGEYSMPIIGEAESGQDSKQVASAVDEPSGIELETDEPKHKTPTPAPVSQKPAHRTPTPRPAPKPAPESSVREHTPTPQPRPMPTPTPTPTPRPATQEMLDEMDEVAANLSNEEENVKALGHIVWPIVLGVLFIAAIVGIKVYKNKIYESYYNQGRVFVYTSNDSDTELKVKIDGKKTSLPVEGMFLPFGWHEVELTHPKYELERERFELNNKNPVEGFYFKLKPKKDI